MRETVCKAIDPPPAGQSSGLQSRGQLYSPARGTIAPLPCVMPNTQLYAMNFKLLDYSLLSVFIRVGRGRDRGIAVWFDSQGRWGFVCVRVTVWHETQRQGPVMERNY